MKIAVLGFGSAGRRHAANAVALDHEVVVFDPAVSEVPTGVKRAASQGDAISSAQAVIVATPNSLHADQAVAALDAGRPVLVEKPLAVDLGDAERVARAARESGATCGIAMNLRFHPAVVEMKRLVQGGELGPVRLAEVAFGYDLRLWRPQTDYRTSYSARAELGGGIALDSIHELDYLLWLLGPVDSVIAETGQISTLELDVEDVAVAILRFKCGAIATVSLNYFEPVYRRGALIVGEDAVAQWVWGQPELRIRRADRGEQSSSIGTDLTPTYVDVVEDFASAVERGDSPRTSVDQGLEAVRVVVALKRSASQGRRVTVG